MNTKKKNEYKNVNTDYFEILTNGYKNNEYKKKTCAGITYQASRPTLNIGEQLVALTLFTLRCPEV